MDRIKNMSTTTLASAKDKIHSFSSSGNPKCCFYLLHVDFTRIKLLELINFVGLKYFVGKSTLSLHSYILYIVLNHFK